jgi:hypothetical protein
MLRTTTAPVGVLSGYLVDALTVQRRKAWTRAFILRTHPDAVADPNDAFSPIVGSPIEAQLMGDWVFRDENVMQGTPAGQMNTADVVVNTSILYSGSFVEGVTRMSLEGIECSVDRVTHYPDTQELVVVGTKVAP